MGDYHLSHDLLLYCFRESKLERLSVVCLHLT